MSSKCNGATAPTYSKQRIVRNTGLLYGRMLLTVWFNLWASRLTLANLGVDDLGVFGVVGSVVSMFAVFSNGLTTAVQRFITYELGRGEKGEVDRVFSTSLNVLLLLALATVIIIEPVGLWLINHKLNIPVGSLTAAHWVFQFTVLAFLFEIIAIPYNALVIAHEKMDAFAAISILKVLLTCAAAWSLSLFASGRLIVYGALMAAIAIFIRIIYQVYCHRHFAEARYHFSIDRAKMGEISRFAGVSTLGGILYTISGEGIMLVINWTFGVAINAVYTIALQLKNMILSFALNLFKAIQPQITKTYAEGALDVHRRLVYSGSKLEVYLIYFLMLPFLCRTEQIMALWLGDVPAYAVSYAQGIVFISLTYAAFEPIRTAVLATGRIVKFMLIPDSLTLLVLPISYLVARMTGSPTWMLVSIVGMEMFACALRVWLGAQVSALRVREILSRIVLPAAVVALVDAVLCYFLSRLLPDDLWGLILLVLLNSLLLLGIIYAIGLSAEERRSILSLRKKSVREQT